MAAASKEEKLNADPPESNFPIYRKYRPDERKLLLFVTAVFALAIYLLHHSRLSLTKYDPSIAGFIIVASFWILHIFLIIKKEQGDEILLPCVAFLIIIGWLVVFRLYPRLAFKQMAWILIGEVVFILWMTLIKDYRVLEDYKYLFLVGAVLVQAAVAIFGKEVNGARLWFDFKLFYFQPVEFVKIFLTIFLASYLKQNREILEKPISRNNLTLLFKYIIPLLLLWSIAESVLIIQRDLGMALLLFGVFMGLFYVTTRKPYVTAAGFLASGAGAYFIYQSFAHVRIRINNWLDPWANPRGVGYQIVQALYAMANGGLTGTGLGMGMPGVIPAVHTDYIFSAISEELGLWGGLIVLCVFLVLIQRMFKTAITVADEFSSFLSLGLALLFATQVFVIIAGCVKLIPLTGITLPFMSYGGSSLVSNFILMGIFFQISGKINQTS